MSSNWHGHFIVLPERVVTPATVDFFYLVQSIQQHTNVALAGHFSWILSECKWSHHCFFSDPPFIPIKLFLTKPHIDKQSLPWERAAWKNRLPRALTTCTPSSGLSLLGALGSWQRKKQTTEILTQTCATYWLTVSQVHQTGLKLVYYLFSYSTRLYCKEKNM